MPIETLIAVLGSTFAILAAMLSLFLWLRSEANVDSQHDFPCNFLQQGTVKPATRYGNPFIFLQRNFQDIQRDDKKDLMQLTRNIEYTIIAIHHEVKDFHTRLIKIEEKHFKDKK